MPRLTRIILMFSVFCVSGCGSHPAAAGPVKLKDTPGDHLDVLIDGKVAARYMYAYDKSTPERLAETFKPYLHVFDAEGKAPITKGAGGEFPHHHGIFIGWNKIGFAGKTYDRWHMKGGEIVHQKFAAQSEGASASFTAISHWNDEAGAPILVESRTTTVTPAAVPGRLVVDFTSELVAPSGEIMLDGDPEHAGVHFRPSDTADRAKTSYLYPKENAEPHKDVDYPWVGMTFTLQDTGKQYSVVQMNHPTNPKGTRWSAYRNYGRFGAFPTGTVKEGSPLALRYRFLIADGEAVPVEAIQKSWDEFSKSRVPTPVPNVTRLPAEVAKPKAPAKPKQEQPATSATTTRPSTTQATTAPANFKGHPTNAGPVDAPILFDVPTPEPLNVEAALKTFALPEGLRIEPVASEPMVEDPVAMSFDEQGRMYVVEMRSYMQDVDGNREDEPIGRIKRLTDTDGDGRMDRAEVFIDKLVMPRAVMATRGGVLVGEPPELAFWEDTDNDGKADKKTVVATDYGRRDGQPEHTANTPTLALDNWIYNAAHPARFRFVRGKWTAEPTRIRGQWGMTQDDVGRLYFSTNSDVARADPLPGLYFSRNPYYKAKSSQNVALMTTQAVWPSHPTPGVNRGYTKDQLRDDGTLATATAAGGSAIYRGDLLPAEFLGNLFTPEPSGNLIKRMLVTDSGGKLAATNAYDGKDFLTSTDERFRPVQACTGPDGALYVVDMYHGVLQHRYFLTHYLIKNIKQRKLETPIHWGRIYRIVPDDALETPVVLAPPGTGARSGARIPAGASTTGVPKSAVALPTDQKGWVEALGHPNGWIRDTAQRVLVEKNDRAITPLVKKVATVAAPPLTRLHALWTLEGMGRLDEQTTLAALKDSDPAVRAAAIRLSEPLLVPATRMNVQPALLRLASDPAPAVQLQLILSLGAIPDPAIESIVADLVTHGTADADLVRNAALSGMRSRELEFAERLLARPDWQTESPARAQTLTELARCVLNERRSTRVARLLDAAAGEAEGSWRQVALLHGMTPKVDPKAKAPVIKLIYLDTEPAALAALLASTNTTVRTLAEQADARLAWPGKPGVPPPPVVRPLTPDEQTLFNRGREVYAQTCAACHQPSGLGVEGVAPPLVDSEWVTGSPDRLARIVLHGVTGPISVNGALYKMEMPALPTLPDADIAAALTYVRRDWEHTADPITEKTVVAIREATKNRTDLWTAKELLGVE